MKFLGKIKDRYKIFTSVLKYSVSFTVCILVWSSGNVVSYISCGAVKTRKFSPSWYCCCRKKPPIANVSKRKLRCQRSTSEVSNSIAQD